MHNLNKLINSLRSFDFQMEGVYSTTDPKAPKKLVKKILVLYSICYA
jgi:hypothetical protein